MSNVLSKKRITLPEVNTGEMLTETIRAYMHGAVPSALLSRIGAGLDAFLADESLNAEDREFVMQFRVTVDAMHTEWRAKEDELYLSPARAVARYKDETPNNGE